MVSPNGQPQQQQGEPVDFAEVLEYWRDQTMDLHSRLAISNAMIKNRDREISDLRKQLEKANVERLAHDQKPLGG